MKTSSPFSIAHWISAPFLGGAQVASPAPYLRKTFAIDGPIESAQLVITALGLYDAEINGQAVGARIFAPGWTDYRTRVQYQIHDVTPLLQTGENAFGVILGDGWYCGYVGWLGRQNYGDRPHLLAELTVRLTDGRKIVISSDESWKVSEGPILESDLLMGESYDARRELSGWSEVGFDDSQWRAVVIQPAPEIELSPSLDAGVKRHETLVSKTEGQKVDWGNSRRIYDFGQNFSGRIRLKVEAPRGITLKIRYAEVLNPDGTPYYENLRGARATDHYTCKGGGEQWEPRFTFHGFRYVEVLGLKPEHALEIEGIVLHSDTPRTGHFACSNPLLNQLQQNIIWGQKSNFLEVPTDCPQRDERLGWTGDAQVFIRTACFNMNVQDFFHKWMRDARDAQNAEGAVPPIIPEPRVIIEDGGPAWSDATIICPWVIYLCYNDRKILADHYESMKRYVGYHAGAYSKDFIRCHPDIPKWSGFGDWLALDGSGDRMGATPHDLIGTAFLAYDFQLMSRIATVLEKTEEAQGFAELRTKVVAAFRRRFVTPEGLIAASTQTAYVLALHFDLLPEAARATAVAELVRKIKKNGNHLGTGFVGTPYLLDVLEANGHLDLAYTLLEQETFPSWLFPVKNGATTIWERWDGWTTDKGFQDKGMNSFNHYAYGAVGAWMVRSAAGLELDPSEPGYRHIVFRPRPGGSLTWAEAELETPFGKAGIRWDLQNSALAMKITVPAGTRATFSAPEGYGDAEKSFDSGTHQFSLARV